MNKTSEREKARHKALDKRDHAKGKTVELKHHIPVSAGPPQPMTGGADSQIQDMLSQIEQGSGDEY